MTRINNNVNKDLRHVICVSGIVVLTLVGFMFFSPLSLYFDEESISRGDSWETDIDDLMTVKNYDKALNMTDSIIKVKTEGLPRFSYFDRFLPENERMYAVNARADIYDLQWDRIIILQKKNDLTELKISLNEYSKINGYNQDKAKSMLNEIKDL